MTGLEVPLEVAMVLCAGCAAAGAWAGRARANRRLDPRRNPLRDLMKPAVLAEAIDLAHYRDARRGASQAVLHGRIDQLASAQSWDPEMRAQVREHIAAVMRNGLRRNDHFVLGAAERSGDGFTIHIAGADERTAVGIADRLRRVLAQLHMPHLGRSTRFTASFGVAAGRIGESGTSLAARARQALEAAVAQGSDHVVPASAIEEVLLLPAPEAPASASAA